MERITIELPIVKVNVGDNYLGSDYAKEHYEEGLFLIDDGISQLICAHDGNGCVWNMPCPVRLVQDGIERESAKRERERCVEVLEGIDERLKSMSNAITSNGKVLDFLRNEIVAHTSVVNEMWDGVVDDMKDNHKEVMMKLDDMPKSVGGEGVSILDVARSFAIIQKPELIKELNK
jgi:hypothetical protein